MRRARLSSCGLKLLSFSLAAREDEGTGGDRGRERERQKNCSRAAARMLDGTFLRGLVASGELSTRHYFFLFCAWTDEAFARFRLCFFAFSRGILRRAARRMISHVYF